MNYKLFTDGGARGNPGPSGIGAVIYDEAGQIIFELAKYIGKGTNNEAEYIALIEGLKAASEKNIKKLTSYLDSELICKQVRGEYKVKNERLRRFYTMVKELENNFVEISFVHVKRDKNKKADALANQALDQHAY